MISTLAVVHAASLWYPVMLAQERCEISETKAAELLGTSLEQYRKEKEAAIAAVMQLVSTLKSPLHSLVDAIRERPELFQPIHSGSCSTSKSGPESCSSPSLKSLVMSYDVARRDHE